MQKNNVKFEILQLSTSEDFKPYLFVGYDYASKKGFNLSHYKKVYEGVVDIEKSVNNTLEELFIRFNCHLPSDFKGHSLSTSDVIKLGNHSYYCDSIGWVQVD